MAAEVAPYPDRVAAGDALARCLVHYADHPGLAVLGIPRGGVVLAARVAVALGAPLDLVTVRKLALPGQPELAMGAIAGFADRVDVVSNDRLIARALVTPAEFDDVRAREEGELWRQDARFRRGRHCPDLGGRIVIVVDDGLATGSTMRAAIAVLRRTRPARIVVAVPIGSPQTCALIARQVDELVCPWVPDQFFAVGHGYLDFGQTAEAEVIRLLAR